MVDRGPRWSPPLPIPVVPSDDSPQTLGEPMTLYALDDLDDALETTRAFLLPFDRGRWARLLLIVFFLGGVGGTNPFQFSGFGGSDSGVEPGPDVGPADGVGPGSGGIEADSAREALTALGGPEIAVIVAIAGLLLAVTLGFAFVGSVMEFVFVESLRRDTVTIRRYWRTRWRQGLRLFGFRLVLGAFTLGIVFGGLFVALSPLVFGSGSFSVSRVVVVIPVIIVVSLASGLVGGFTTAFVVPVMIAEERGVLAAWRRFWPTLTGQWKQYLAYVVARFVLEVAGSILVGILVVVGLIVLAIPTGIVGVVGVAAADAAGPIGWVVVGLAVVVFVIAAILLALVVSVPVQTYLRYYALCILGDTNEAFDLIAERRRVAGE